MISCSELRARSFREFYEYTLHEASDPFYVVGRKRDELDVSGRPMKLVRSALVASFREMLTRDGGKCHHHGSIDDPLMCATYYEARQTLTRR